MPPNQIWLFWSILLAIACWYCIIMQTHRSLVVCICVLLGILGEKWSHWHPSNTVEIISIPPYHYTTINSDNTCITFVSILGKNDRNHWHRWLNLLVCEANILIVEQQELWQESIALALIKKKHLTELYAPKNTISTTSCVLIQQRHPAVHCQVTKGKCQCQFFTQKSSITLLNNGIAQKHHNTEDITTTLGTTNPYELITP